MAGDMKKMPEEYWKKKLTPEQYHILREKGTERTFSGKYVSSHDKGIYVCSACGATLFSSDTKFDSGTGWPSFDRPENLENIELQDDNSLGMRRVEVICKNCGSHLGHVFDDLPRLAAGKAGGPTLTRKRYCINSACLAFQPKN